LGNSVVRMGCGRRWLRIGFSGVELWTVCWISLLFSGPTTTIMDELGIQILFTLNVACNTRVLRRRHVFNSWLYFIHNFMYVNDLHTDFRRVYFQWWYSYRCQMWNEIFRMAAVVFIFHVKNVRHVLHILRPYFKRQQVASTS
jgi:hypothetical protein